LSHIGELFDWAGSKGNAALSVPFWHNRRPSVSFFSYYRTARHRWTPVTAQAIFCCPIIF